MTFSNQGSATTTVAIKDSDLEDNQCDLQFTYGAAQPQLQNVDLDDQC